MKPSLRAELLALLQRHGIAEAAVAYVRRSPSRMDYTFLGIGGHTLTVHERMVFLDRAIESMVEVRMALTARDN